MSHKNQSVKEKIKYALMRGACSLAGHLWPVGHVRCPSGEWRGFYHVHIRKTGGTSINKMFLLLHDQDGDALYTRLSRSLLHRMCIDGRVYVGWNPVLINSGNYFYAFSHLPFHNISIPDDIFTFTCFRDPVKRVLSHYNMLMQYRENGVRHPCMKMEGLWLGASFTDFFERIPREHLLMQLYMFSSSFDQGEALLNVRSLSHVMFTEQFDEGIQQLNTLTGLGLQPVHTRKTTYRANIGEEDLSRLRERLAPEYSFLEAVRALLPMHRADRDKAL